MNGFVSMVEPKINMKNSHCVFTIISYLPNLNSATFSIRLASFYCRVQVLSVLLALRPFVSMISACQHENISLIDSNYTFDEIPMSPDSLHLLDKQIQLPEKRKN